MRKHTLILAVLLICILSSCGSPASTDTENLNTKEEEAIIQANDSLNKVLEENQKKMQEELDEMDKALEELETK